MNRKALTLLLSTALFFPLTYADNIKEGMMEIAQQATITTSLPNQLQSLIQPQEQAFSLVLTQNGLHNKSPVTLYRYEPKTILTFEAMNSSFLINDETQKIQGFARLLPQYDAKQPQVSKEDAEKAMREFATQFAPDLLKNFKIQWIDKHDETIIVDGKKVKLTGMKVKCRDIDTGLYFWMIIAPDHSVMVFERDVEWDFIRAGRQTQKWLHDSWLQKNI